MNTYTLPYVSSDLEWRERDGLLSTIKEKVKIF